MGEHHRIQQRYERLLRERAAASLMGEAAAAAEQEAGREEWHGAGRYTEWCSPEFLEDSTQQHPMMINPAEVEAGSAMLSYARDSGLSRHMSQQWRPTRTSGQGGAPITCPSQVRGPQPAGTAVTHATSAASAPLGRTSGACTQATGSPVMYSQVPIVSAADGPAPRPNTVQPQPAGGSVTSSTCKPAQREEHKKQASSSDTFQGPATGPHCYTEQQSTSTLHHMCYAPRVATIPGHNRPLNNAGPSVAGHAPAPLPSAVPSLSQMAPHYVSSVTPVPLPPAGYQQCWPATLMYLPVMPQGPQPGPSRNRPSMRTPPFSGQHTPIQQPLYFQTITPYPLPFQAGAQHGAGQSATQPPTQEAFKGSIEIQPSSMYKYKASKCGRATAEKMIPIEVKPDVKGFDIPIKKEPEEEVSGKPNIDHKRDEAGIKPKAEINPNANIDPVGYAYEEEFAYGGEEFYLDEYESGPEEYVKGEGYLGEEFSYSYGEQPGDAATLQQQVPLPPSAPWAATGAPEPIYGPPPNGPPSYGPPPNGPPSYGPPPYGPPPRGTCRVCGQVTIPGLLCLCCSWKPTPGDGPATLAYNFCKSVIIMPEPTSGLPPQVCLYFGEPVATTTNAPNQPSASQRQPPATVGGTISGTSGGPEKIKEPSVTGAAPTHASGQPIPTRTSNSTVQVNIDSKSEGESCSADDGKAMQETKEKLKDKEGENEQKVEDDEDDEDEEEQEEEEEEEEEGNQGQQELPDVAVKECRESCDQPIQEGAVGTTTAANAPKDEEDEDEGER